MNADFDTVVIGGGIVGLCVTWFLAEEGAAVICLDDGRGAGSDANAGSLHVQMQSRLMRLFPERLPDYEKTLAMYPRAVDFWLELARHFADDVELKLAGGLMIAESAAQMESLAEKVRTERRHGIETSLLGRDELLRMAPYLSPEVHGAAHCAQEGKINPLLANAAVRQCASRSGGTIRRGSPVDRIERAHGAYAVRCAGEVYRAGRVVIAAGAGSGPLAASLGLRLPATAEPLHMNVTDPVEAFVPHLVQHAERPITLKQMQNGQLLIGGGWPARSAGSAATPDVVLDSLLGNLALARQLVPRTADLSLIRTWAGINTLVDLLSVLGRFETHPDVYAAIPGDAGYTLGPYCARLVVDQMSGREPDFPMAGFAPRRFDR